MGHEAADVLLVCDVGFGDAPDLVVCRVAELPLIGGFMVFVACDEVATAGGEGGGKVAFADLAVGPEEGFDELFGAAPCTDQGEFWAGVSALSVESMAGAAA